MQYQSIFQLQAMNLRFPEQEQLKCPRCDSNNTKFCYYNNYNLSQPRHFCKNCKRYWTKGGALRNIPVGGGSHKNNKDKNKNKRSSNNNQHPKSPTPAADPDLNGTQNPSQEDAGGVGLDSQQARIDRSPSPLDQERKILDVSGSFSWSGQFGGLLEGLNRNASSDLTSGQGSESRGGDAREVGYSTSWWWKQ